MQWLQILYTLCGEFVFYLTCSFVYIFSMVEGKLMPRFSRYVSSGLGLRFFSRLEATHKKFPRKKTIRDLTKPLLRPSLAHHKFFPPAKSFISSFITHYPSPWQTTQI